MKILILDIETSPNTAYVWGLFKENIPLARLIESRTTLCWSAKWYGNRKVMFGSINKDGKTKMLRRIHKLLDDADVVVHFNGRRFDIPNLNREFILAGMAPPAPYKQIDLYEVVKARFQFPSNKLAYVSKALGIPGKVESSDFQLWVRCMNNERAAWEEMEVYNMTDVIIEEQVYERLIPWINNHPNHGLYANGKEVCPNCASTVFTRRGYAFAQETKYQRFQCSDCGHWFRGKKPVDLQKKAKYRNIV